MRAGSSRGREGGRGRTLYRLAANLPTCWRYSAGGFVFHRHIGEGVECGRGRGPGVSGGGDPWLLGLNRPKWAIRGRRHSAAFVGYMRATCGPLASPLEWVEVTILKWRSHCSGLNWGREGSSRLSSLVWKLDCFTPDPNVFKACYIHSMKLSYIQRRYKCIRSGPQRLLQFRWGPF